MAQTRKRRRRKHRGTQAGTVERAGRTGRPAGGRPQTRGEVRDAARQRRQQRFDTPPTWRGALNRALFAALVAAVLIGVVQKNPTAGVVFGLFALVAYLPMSYYTDRFLYNRRQRQKQQGRS